MNLPNKLTVSRIVMAFIFVYFISLNGLAAVVIATVIFTFASLTDYWDGYFAKKYNMISDFGKLMDPIADKLLIAGSLIIFTVLCQGGYEMAKKKAAKKKTVKKATKKKATKKKAKKKAKK